MRLTTLIIGIQACFASMLFAASVRAQTISVDVKNASIKQVFNAIEKQSDVTFIYDEQSFSDLSDITLKIVNARLPDILDKLSAKFPVSFRRSGNVIGVSRIPVKLKPLKAVLNDLNEPIKVTGKVYGSKNELLTGVIVTIKGTTQSTASDKNGEYTILAKSDQILLFRYIGYITKEVPISGRNEVDVILEENLSPLDEVNIIAYGTTSQRLTTGAISKVSAADIENQPVANPLAALEGRVAGLSVTQDNGVPGSNFRVQLEGQNALSLGATSSTVNSDPLFVIDGVPFAANNTNINQLSSAISSRAADGVSPLNSINPADIESIEVLKDAAATAIYGSRGAYGVILITTKKGKAGQTKVDINVKSGVSAIEKKLDLLNLQQYLALRENAFANDNVTPTADIAPDLLQWSQTSATNWEKYFIENVAHSTDAEATISGGNQNTQFLLSGGFHHESTVFADTKGEDRGSFHVSVNHTSEDKKFTALFSAQYSSDKNDEPSLDMTSNIYLPPNYPSLLDSKGNLVWTYDNSSLPLSNPLASVYQPYTAQTDNLLGNLSLGYKIVKGLEVRTSLGYNMMLLNETQLFPAYTEDPQYAEQGSSNFATNEFKSWIIEPQAEYKTIISKGNLDIIAGGTLEQSDNSNSNILAYGYSSDALLNSLGAASGTVASNSATEYKYAAIFARVDYNWDEKYLVDITGNRDGSSRFGPGKQFGNFGAVGLGWIFTKEGFIENSLPALSFGKIRASYGITGSDQIGDYQYLDSWSSTSNPYQGTSGLYPTRLVNPDYSWEVNRKFDAGIDLGFLKDRILFTADYYLNRSSNHLINYALPSQTGFTSIVENFPATIQNKGLQLSISSKNITDGRLKWQTSANLTVPQNKLVSFPGIATSSYGGTYEVGQSLSTVKGLVYTGVNPSTGLVTFKDINGDGVINGSDVVPLASLDPKYYGGIQNTFTYKSFSLEFFVQFTKQLGRNDLFNIYSNIPGSLINFPASVIDRWHTPGQTAAFQQATATPGTAAYNAANLFTTYANNSAEISDASFLRLKNLSFSYNFPANLLRSLHMSSLRIYLSGQNLWILTGYKGFDPETQSDNTLPPLRTITMGIQLTL